MLMPKKHIRISESIIGLAGFILKLIQNDKTIDDLWLDFKKINNTDQLPANHSFDNFLLAIDFLYMIGAINLNENGGVRFETCKT